ncbi:hypothetical protein EJ110_NYTH24206 [Nymphaea thermarum]|nr:hypothetical protein EJ110_NYTH24206 [Nymphaea thermarum]
MQSTEKCLEFGTETSLKVWHNDLCGTCREISSPSLLSDNCHCDLKTINNILVDEEMTEQVGEFGISKLLWEQKPSLIQHLLLEFWLKRRLTLNNPPLERGPSSLSPGFWAAWMGSGNGLYLGRV